VWNRLTKKERARLKESEFIVEQANVINEKFTYQANWETTNVLRREA
jgi:hypothetical protein